LIFVSECDFINNVFWEHYDELRAGNLSNSFMGQASTIFVDKYSIRGLRTSSELASDDQQPTDFDEMGQSRAMEEMNNEEVLAILESASVRQWETLSSWTSNDCPDCRNKGEIYLRGSAWNS